MGIVYLSETKKKIYLLSDTFHKGVINLPVIRINFFKVDIDFSNYDALIFSSKNAVLSVNSFDERWKEIPCFCIGAGTAKVVEELGGKVAYISKNSYGNKFAVEIANLLLDKKVLFLRAKRVLSSLEDILKSLHVKLTSKVVYETTCKENAEHSIDENAIIIFTSPSTIECFFKQYNWKKSYQAVCIGDVTAKHMPQDISLHVSHKQSIMECIKLAQSLEVK